MKHIKLPLNDHKEKRIVSFEYRLPKWVPALALALSSTLLSVASAQQAASPRPFIDRISHIEFDVDRDGRATQTATYRQQVLQEGLLERFKVFSVSHSSSIETAEILEAYTLKPDGRRIAVPPGNYQHQANTGMGNAGPAFSDRTRVSVVFPDFSVGDAIHIRYRVTEKEPMFPGHFSQHLRYSVYNQYDDVQVTVRAPKEMKLHTEAYFLKPQAPTEANGKQVLVWRYANPTPRVYTEEDEGLWSINEIPSVMISTFANHEAIAQAYGARALPKSQPTSRVRDLVAQIVGAATSEREKARLIYEWVSRNITYAGNCIGTGAVVPRDQAVVLDNKMGDCKDHATLLQAMWAAAGIASEQVLVNAGNTYELPKTAVVSMVNHAMNYIPSLQLYVDATAKEVPFGLLPDSAWGKPVIHVGAAKALATIPAEDHMNNQQQLHLTLKVLPSGAASGTLKVSIKGGRAAGARAYFRELDADGMRDFVRHSAQRAGWRARGTLDRGNTEGLSDTYSYSMQFEIENFLRAGTSGAFMLSSLFGSPLDVTHLGDVADRPTPTRREFCHGFHSWETLEIELPSGLELLSRPEDLQVKGSLLDFSARYELEGQRLKVSREVHDKTPVSVCRPEMTAEFNRQGKPIGENLRTQVLFKRSR